MAKETKAVTDEMVMRQAKTYITNPDSLALIMHACSFAKAHHEGQFRKSGEPYTVHLTNVAYILAELHCGPKTIAAGYLHDTIEDTGIKKEELAAQFDEEIADLVDSVTKVGALLYRGKDDPEYQAANHRKIFIAMAKDIRVILIKLADRLHNMRTLQFQPRDAQLRIAAETLDVYGPIAHRLGLSAIKNELEDRAFYYSNPEEYYRIAHLVEMKKAERDASVQKMIREITDMLRENHIPFRIFGRSKHLYSIYHKMAVRHKRFDEILDLLAIRVITATELNCYETLGYIHAKYKPIPGRLKDYIAVPKENMYQSLHTTIIGDEGKIFEVQIRTEEMDEIAEKGVAAHWRYKEGSKYDPRREQKEIEDKLSWFRDFTDLTGNSGGSASEYMETLQKDVFETDVYVMTPKGRVIGLPNGATPIDFAYRIHTDVGNTAVGAIVNDAMVPLNTELHTGDVVQIKTLKGTGPSEDWLKIIKTNQAKNKIRAYFARKENENHERLASDGEKLLAEDLKKRGFDPREYMQKKKLEDLVSQFNVKNYAELMYNVATKIIAPVSIVEKLTNQKRPIQEDQALTRLMKQVEPSKKRVMTKTGIVVPGVESMKIVLAQCCLPVYGDPIIGFITKGDGVRVHRADCLNVKNQAARLIHVAWEEGDRTRMYDSRLRVTSHDRSFLLTDVVTAISQSRVPLVQVRATVNQEKLLSTFRLTIQVHDLDELQTAIANICKVEGVIAVEREAH